MAEWGRDHWSMLAYVETCCVDWKGVIDPVRVRCNPRRHPGLARPQHKQTAGPYDHPTRIRDAKAEPEHDDWDCFYDFEAEGLIEDVGTGIHPVAKLTPLGLRITAELRAHKASGKMYAQFSHP